MAEAFITQMIGSYIKDILKITKRKGKEISQQLMVPIRKEIRRMTKWKEMAY